MKSAKILLPLALVIAAPTSAGASGRSATATSAKCQFVFPVAWFGYMYIPCIAVSNQR